MDWNKVKRSVQRHIPEILTGIAVGGTVTADVLYIYNGIKLTKEAKDGNGVSYVKAFWLPTTISAGTIAAIILSNQFSYKEKTLLLSMCATSMTQMSLYKKTATNILGKDQTDKVTEAFDQMDLEKLMIDADQADETGSYTEDSRLFYFPQIRKVIHCSTDQFNTAVLNINEQFAMETETTINNFFDFINKDIVKNDPELLECGDDFGWLMDVEDPESGLTRILISQYTKKLDSGIDVTYVYFMDPPLHRSEWEDYYNYEKCYWINKGEVEKC